MADIKKKPNLALKNLKAPARQSGNRVMKSVWKVPSDLTKTSKETRATNTRVTWTIATTAQGKKKKKKNYIVKKNLGIATKEASINLANFKVGKTSFSRESFYPFKGKPYLMSVSIKAVPYNKKGNSTAKKQAKATTKFTAPRPPEIGAFSFNNDTGEVSTTITTNDGADTRERYDTYYEINVFDSRTGKWTNANPKSGGKPVYTKTATEFNASYDAAGYMSLQGEEYIQVKVFAKARGFAGDSPKKDNPTKSFYISYPKKPEIRNVSISDLTPSGKCTLTVKTNNTTEHPVDRVRLEYAADVEYGEGQEREIPASAWTSTEIIDDGQCTALAMPIGDLFPSRGNHTWVRIKSYHASENVLYTYSDYKLLKELEPPATETGDINIDVLSAEATESGDSAVVLLGWNKDGRDDFTGTELSWSDDENTWKSTKEPETHQFTWSDGEYPKTGTVEYHDSAEITIKGLAEGKKYWVKARRYLEGDTVEYSAYSNTKDFKPYEKPYTVVATAPAYLPIGEPLSVSWNISSDSEQTEWQITDTTGKPIADGKGPITSTNIPYSKFAEFLVNNERTFYVEVSTGSTFTKSQNIKVIVIDYPTLSITAPNQLTAQNFSFTATSSRLCDLVVTVTSKGASGQFADGFKMQTDGDTIYSNVIPVEWEASGNNFTTTVELPTGLDFWDKGDYELSVVAVDQQTGLKTEPEVAKFDINWNHQAVDPSGAVTLTPVDTVDKDGDHVKGVQIDLTPPAGSAETDVFDIYRFDIDKPHLIAEGFPLTYSVVDEHAPFGEDEELRYRIALRTADGDEEFTDIEYQAEGDYMRFDWSGGYLELPYGNSIGDSFGKFVDIRQHMDGSTDGYWNPNIERKSSLSSNIIKIVQPNEIELSRRLARYAGPVFVRLPNGSAFEADVQVTDMSVKNKAVIAIALDATEVDLTDEYMLPIPTTEEQ